MQTPQASVAAAVARHRTHCTKGGDRCLTSPPIMNRVLRRTIASVSSLAVGALLASSQAVAQPQRLIVDAPAPGRPTRTDLEAACPAIADLLQRELAPSVLLQGKPGTVHVQFDWQGGGVRDVMARGGPAEYRQPIRRALHSVTCAHALDGDRFAFAIRFDPDTDTDADPVQPQRLAQRRAP